MPVAESEQQFVLNWQVMWSEQDVEAACPLVQQMQAKYPQLSVCSFDKGRNGLAGLVDPAEAAGSARRGRSTQGTHRITADAGRAAG